MNQPICYVITHESSKVYDECAKSLKQHGWQFEKFPAIDGSCVTEHDWRAAGVDMNTEGKMSRRPGAQGCWLSHFALWSRCEQMKEAVVIMEHDAVVQSAWPQDLNIEKSLVKLFKSAETKFNPAFGNWSKGAHAYTLTPAQAKILIDHAKNKGAQAVDKHLGDAVLPWTFYKHDLVILNPRRGPSTTSPMRRH